MVKGILSLLTVCPHEVAHLRKELLIGMKNACHLCCVFTASKFTVWIFLIASILDKFVSYILFSRYRSQAYFDNGTSFKICSIHGKAFRRRYFARKRMDNTWIFKTFSLFYSRRFGTSCPPIFTIVRFGKGSGLIQVTKKQLKFLVAFDFLRKDRLSVSPIKQTKNRV